MPTKKKRIGFIPREDVMKIIDRLSIENNLSNSKIISILVEDALYRRGIFNKKDGKVSPSFDSFNSLFENSIEAPTASQDSKKLNKNLNISNKNDSFKTAFLKQNNLDTFDLQTYKKFLLFLKFQEMIGE